MTPASDWRSGAAGFTIVELVITMVVISLAVLAMTTSLGFAFQHQSDGLWRTKTAALAQSYVEEIMARRYDENTPLGGVPACAPATVACTAPGSFDDGEARALFDDVDDYDGVDESPPVDVNGVARAEYAGYRVQVAVAYATAGQVATLGLDATTDAKLVTITVTPPVGDPVAYPFLRANY